MFRRSPAPRVDQLFAKLRRDGRCGLIAYITCGDPDVGMTPAIALELASAGADAIELGIPFSDPIADGPTIQAASQRALSHGAKTADIFPIALRIRMKSEIPLIAFSYLNPILRYGIDRFATDAAKSGIDAVLITDLPPESANDVRKALHRHRIGLVCLLAPTSSNDRLAAIDRASDGFVYYVSTTGVTGARSDLDPELLERLGEVRASVKKPLAVGFGISKREHYEALRNRCDAIVVGSAIVRAIAEGEPDLAPLRAAVVVRRILGR